MGLIRLILHSGAPGWDLPPAPVRTDTSSTRADVHLLSECSATCPAVIVWSTGGVGDSDSVLPKRWRGVLQRDYPEAMICVVVAVVRRRCEVMDMTPHKAGQ